MNIQPSESVISSKIVEILLDEGVSLSSTSRILKNVKRKLKEIPIKEKTATEKGEKNEVRIP